MSLLRVAPRLICAVASSTLTPEMRAGIQVGATFRDRASRCQRVASVEYSHGSSTSSSVHRIALAKAVRCPSVARFRRHDVLRRRRALDAQEISAAGVKYLHAAPRWVGAPDHACAQQHAVTCDEMMVIADKNYFMSGRTVRTS